MIARGRRSAAGAVVAISALATGCLRAFAPEVGPARATDAGTGDATGAGCANAVEHPDPTVSFSTDLQRGVFERARCNNCHTGDGIGVTQSGLDLSSYSSLRTGGGRSGANIVVAGTPCASILYQKLGAAPPFGRRMPYDGPPYLTTTELQLVHDWIAEGARDN